MWLQRTIGPVAQTDPESLKLPGTEDAWVASRKPHKLARKAHELGLSRGGSAAYRR
ncbi:hypothetical protein GCM10022399_18540 [Terrabacter ginsenosidimutans]|uniref:Uncharacterized protein n=1 Tax=Terrabacter ginsenosidimutans TaxID=490575 RepID=A0ABP7DCE6_9MICO